jgi:hypothetical protein
MEQTYLNVKRSQSDNFSLHSSIISPSPIRKPSRISFNVAREIFDLPSSMDELDNNTMNASWPGVILTKYHSTRTDGDSGSEWGTDSSNSNSIQGDFESPAKINVKSQLLVDGSDDSFSEIVPERVHNPIIHDINFMRCNNQETLKFNIGSTFVSRP